MRNSSTIGASVLQISNGDPKAGAVKSTAEALGWSLLGLLPIAEFSVAHR